VKLFVQRSRAQLETKDHPIIDPSAFRKWPPGGPRLRNARNLSCLSPTQSGEFDKFQWSEHGPQAIFCQPSPFRPFWGRQNGHSVEGESSRHRMTSAPGRRSGAHSSVQKSTTTIYENNVTPLGRKRGRIQDSDQHSNRGPNAEIRQRPPAERPPERRGCYPCGYKSYRRRTAGATGRLWVAPDLEGRISRVPPLRPSQLGVGQPMEHKNAHR